MKHPLIGLVVLGLCLWVSVSWSEPPAPPEAKDKPETKDKADRKPIAHSDKEEHRLRQPETMKQPAPELGLITQYVGKEKPKFNKTLAGKVVLVSFWSSGSPTSSRNFNHFAEWRKLYKDEGLEIILIHTADVGQKFPVHTFGTDTLSKDDEAELAKLRETITRAAKANPIVAESGIDATGEVKREWSVRRTPTFYLLDKKGNLRYCYESSLEYQKLHNEPVMREKLVELLKEKDDVDK